MKKVLNWTVVGWLAFAFIILQEIHPIHTQLNDIEARFLGLSKAVISKSRSRNEKSGEITQVTEPTKEVRKKISMPSGQQLSASNLSAGKGASEPQKQSKKITKFGEEALGNKIDVEYTERRIGESRNATEKYSEKTNLKHGPAQRNHIDIIDLYISIHQKNK